MLPDLCAYTPWSDNGNLGNAYNRIMERLRPGEWAIFLDHDAMTLTNDFWKDMQNAMDIHPSAGAIVTWTNRCGNPRQKAKTPSNDDIAQHTLRAEAIRKEYGQRTTDITSERMTGVCFAVSRDAWDKIGPFDSGFGEIDNGWARKCVAGGLRIWRMDGVYVYHQRRTNGWKGEVRMQLNAARVSWDYSKTSTTIAKHGDAELQSLVAAHELSVENAGQLNEEQKAPLRAKLINKWRAAMRVSVVIPSREEPPDELRVTISSYKENGAHEVIVIDDGSVMPVADDCGADIIVRHDNARGVASSRNEGLGMATGNVIVFSDSHCKIAETSHFLDWAYEAYCTDDFMCAVCGSYENPDKWYWGCNLPWRSWRFDVSAGTSEIHHPAGVFGSVYCAARWTWGLIGGWVPTKSWGYNEQAMSLACHRAAVPIRIEPWFRIRHKFRNNGKFPYPTSGWDFQSNAPFVHWLLFDDPLWMVFREAMLREKPEVNEHFSVRLDETAKIEKARYAGLRRAVDAQVLERIQAKGLLSQVDCGIVAQ